MSSTLRTVAQIPPRIKYLVAVAATSNASANILADTCYSFTCAAGTFSKSLISTTEAAAIPSNANVTADDFAAGDLYKDLGRQLVIYDATTDAHLIIYRAVQIVDDDAAGHEGVPPTYPTARYVRVWAASGAGVRVARTGPGAH
jgi:hypothetical protein